MKILAIGDFHGKFPVKLKKIAKKVDLIVSYGDYRPWRLLKIFLKECYRTDRELWEVVGKTAYKKSSLKDIRDGENILSVLNSLNKPIVSTIGNYDTPRFNDTFNENRTLKTKWEWDNKDFFSPIIKKYNNIKRVDYQAIKIKNLVIIGGFGHSNRGNVKSKAYRKSRKKLDILFKKYVKENKEGRVIFLFHNMPYNCKLDVVRDSKANECVKGKHLGNKLTRRIIDRYQPILAIGGHFHENQGKCKIGKSLVLNGGAAFDGKCAVIDFDEIKGRIKNIRFVK